MAGTIDPSLVDGIGLSHSRGCESVLVTSFFAGIDFGKWVLLSGSGETGVHQRRHLRGSRTRTALKINTLKIVLVSVTDGF